MLFFLCLNLASFMVSEMDIFSATEGLTTVNTTQLQQTFNVTEMVDTYAGTSDPASDIAGTKNAVAFYWNMFRSMFTGFGDALAGISAFPDYMRIPIVVLWATVQAAFVVGFIRGQSIE